MQEAPEAYKSWDDFADDAAYVVTRVWTIHAKPLALAVLAVPIHTLIHIRAHPNMHTMPQIYLALRLLDNR